MKRRQFLVSSAGLVGASTCGLGWAESRPCPPSTIAARGGTQTAGQCGSAAAEADWLTRSTDQGVVWAHDFRHVEEVDNFRQSESTRDLQGTPVLEGRGPDPKGVGYHTVYQGTDGIPGTGGRCLRTVAPAGFAKFHPDSWWQSTGSASGILHQPGKDPLTLSQSQAAHLGMIGGGGWNRPLAPFNAGGNGLPAPDPAVGGTLLRYDWNPNERYQLSYWSDSKRGFWAHPDYKNQFTEQNPVGPKVIGYEFWLQWRFKFSSGRHTPRIDVSGGKSRFANGGREWPPGGKLAFIDRYPGGNQEIIPISGGPDPWYFNKTYPFRWYTEFGRGSTVPLPSNPSRSTMQPGGPYEGTCLMGGNTAQPNMCWEWPEDEWVTVLAHIRPGHQNAFNNYVTKDTLVEFKVARWGETKYTTVYSSPFAIRFDEDAPFGWNKLAFNCYMNSFPSFREFSQSYTQVILSSREIACPQVYGV